MALIREFEKGTLNIERINYAVIILIPKEDNAKTLRNSDQLA
jgi:hypothetical protein